MGNQSSLPTALSEAVAAGRNSLTHHILERKRLAGIQNACKPLRIPFADLEQQYWEQLQIHPAAPSKLSKGWQPGRVLAPSRKSGRESTEGQTRGLVHMQPKHKSLKRNWPVSQLYNQTLGRNDTWSSLATAAIGSLKCDLKLCKAAFMLTVEEIPTSTQAVRDTGPWWTSSNSSVSR